MTDDTDRSLNSEQTATSEQILDDTDEIKMERLIDKLRKIEALAMSGIEGEQKAAQALLNMLCDKYKVTLDQLAIPTRQRYTFSVKDGINEMLLIQIVGYICQIHNVKYYKQGRTYRIFELTATEAIDVKDCYEHYRKVWSKQTRNLLKDLMGAFINRHEIFGPPSDDENQPKEVTERAIRISALMSAIQRNQWNRRRKLEG